MTPNKADKIHTMKDKKDKDVYLQAIALIDPALGWIGIRSMLEARADQVIN